MKRLQKTVPVRICLAGLFSYLVLTGCTDPLDLIDPIHLTFVPNIQQLQAAVGSTSTGKRRVVLTWRYDTLNTNIRTWDIQRALDDTSLAALNFLELVRKPDAGYPLYIDSSAQLQNLQLDSLDAYYRIIPNGDLRNYIGEPSGVLHVIVRRTL
jgi:hypothetical protein